MMNRKMDGWIDRWMVRWMDIWMNRWMSGLIGGSMHERMDRWIREGYMSVSALQTDDDDNH